MCTVIDFTGSAHAQAIILYWSVASQVNECSVAYSDCTAGFTGKSFDNYRLSVANFVLFLCVCACGHAANLPFCVLMDVNSMPL